MRIAHVLTRLLRAGSEENTLLTCDGQIRAGHEVFILHGHEVQPDYALRQAPEVKLIEIPDLTHQIHPSRDLSAYRQLKARLAALRPDVVHTHQSKAGIVGRFAAAAVRVPLVVHGVHILPFLGVGAARRATYVGVERAAARVTDGFLHVSEGMLKACLAHGVGRGRQHFVVPSGFDLKRFAMAEPPSDRRKLLHFAPEEDHPVVVTMLAALEPRKRHLELIQHLERFLQAHPGVRVLLAGEGALRSEVEAAIARANLADRVRILGFREDPERIIAMSDVCIHTAEREGLPRSVLQYVAARRPVVMFDLPGLEVVVRNGRNGHVLPQGDWPGFLDRLSTLVTDPAARTAMGYCASQVDMSPWDAPLMAARTLAIYDRLAGGSRPIGVAA